MINHIDLYKLHINSINALLPTYVQKYEGNAILQKLNKILKGKQNIKKYCKNLWHKKKIVKIIF